MTDKIDFFEKHSADTIVVSTWNYPKPAIIGGGVIQMNPNVEHGHNFLTLENITQSISVPTELAVIALISIDVVIKDETVFLRFANATIGCTNQFK